MELEDQSEILLAILNELRSIRDLLMEKEKQNNQTMDDGQRSAIGNDGQELPKRGKWESSTIEFVQSVDWAFKRDQKGGYTYSVANNAARDWFKKHGVDDRLRLMNWCLSKRQALQGRVFVTTDMFDHLWDDLLDGRF